MKFYFIIDIFIFCAIVFFTYYNYINRNYIKVFDYIKIFLFVFISSKFSYTMYLFLGKINILKTDSIHIGILIAFAINLTLLIYFYKYIFKLLNYLFSSQRTKMMIARVVSFLESIIIITFIVFILMQIKPIKNMLSSSINKTYSYSYIKKFYLGLIDKNFTSIFLSSDSKINRQESILKSIKNSL